MASQHSAVRATKVAYKTTRLENVLARVRTVLIAAIGAACALTSVAANAATITVNSLADPGAPGICAFRDAITAANSQTRVNACNAGSGNDTIKFSVSGIIVTANFLNSPLITDNQLSINGPVTFACGPEALGPISVAAGATVKLNNMTLTGIIGDCSGDAIQNEGVLTLANSMVTTRIKFASFNYGTMIVTNSTFTGNAGDGGFGPSAIGNEPGGRLIVINSTFSENVDSAVVNGGQATISDSTFADNGGRFAVAIFNDDGTLTVINSTFSGNLSENNGAIFNLGELAVISSTFFGNGHAGTPLDTPTPIGDLENLGSLTVRNTILAGSADFSGTQTVTNCANPSLNPSFGSVTDAGYNISDDDSCGFSGTSRNNTNPGLSSDGLTNNGGSTQTIALAGDSPAIDVIPLADCTDQNGKRLKTDQRGFPRPDAGEDVCDVGAFETQGGCSQNQQGNNNCQ